MPLELLLVPLEESFTSRKHAAAHSRQSREISPIYASGCISRKIARYLARSGLHSLIIHQDFASCCRKINYQNQILIRLVVVFSQQFHCLKERLKNFIQFGQKR